MQETVVFPQVRHKCREKLIDVKLISFYEEHLRYGSVGSGPHCISVTIRILWRIVLANCKLGCSVNHGRCYILLSVHVQELQNNKCIFTPEVNAFISFHDANFKQFLACPSRGNDRSCRVVFYPSTRTYRSSSSQETKVSMTVPGSSA